jgi:hypothetical protein
MKKLFFILVFFLLVGRAMAINWDSGFDKGKLPASQISTDTTDFNKNLGPADTNVQHALDTLDNYSPDLSAYSTTAQGDLRWLGINATAANSTLFNGQNSSYYATNSSLANYVPYTGANNNVTLGAYNFTNTGDITTGDDLTLSNAATGGNPSLHINQQGAANRSKRLFFEYQGTAKAAITSSGQTTGNMIFQTNPSSGLHTALTIDENGNFDFADGTILFDNNVALGGFTAARDFGVNRNTITPAGGFGLTVHSGGATSGENNATGGNLTLSSGIATGTGSSSIALQTATAGGTGSTDRTPTTKWTIDGAGSLLSGTDGTSAYNLTTTGTLGAGAITGTSLIKSGGTSSQFLKADGSVDSNTYVVGTSYATYTPASGATATLDARVRDHWITMPAGNITIAVSNAAFGLKFNVYITQDGTGSRTVTWFTTIKWVGGTAPVLTTTASKRDAFSFFATASNTYDGYSVGFNI